MKDSPSVNPVVSVIIRNRDESQNLRQVLLALSVQVGPPIEIIVVDNDSRDDSVRIARSYGATVVHLAQGDFTYGRALNSGIAVASGDICVILSAHSLPLGTNFIRSCLRPFNDSNVAAVRCVYVGKTADLTRWTAPEILDSSTPLPDVLSKGPLASGCAIRRSAWAQVPFDESLLAAEDKLWAMAVVRRGYTIYSPCDAFYLYMKTLSPAQALKKNDREMRALFYALGWKPQWGNVPRVRFTLGALRAMGVGVGRSALSVVHRELTRIRLHLTFPKN